MSSEPIKLRLVGGCSDMPIGEVARCSDARVGDAVRVAIATLLDVDRDLFAIGVHERTVAARLAMHLQPELQDWSVDCEYNREGHDPKEIQLPAGVIRPFPDIIVHRRMRRDNLLVIEMKLCHYRNGRAEQRDLQKISAYLSGLEYKHGLFLRLRGGIEPNVEQARWFEDIPLG